jgi:hypothetical protein
MLQLEHENDHDRLTHDSALAEEGVSSRFFIGGSMVDR